MARVVRDVVTRPLRSRRALASRRRLRPGREATLTGVLYRCGVRPWMMQLLSTGSVGLCVVLWIRAKTVDQDERGNAERRALFVGLWPPTIWLIGESIARHE